MECGTQRRKWSCFTRPADGGRAEALRKGHPGKSYKGNFLSIMVLPLGLLGVDPAHRGPS